MATVQEEISTLVPMTWLEFVKDEGQPLKELYEWTLDAREVQQEYDTPVKGDDYPDKTWLLNLIAMFSVMGFYGADATIKIRLRKRLHDNTVEDIKELSHVPRLMRSMIQAEQARRYVYPHRAITVEEIGWQADRAGICSKVYAELVQMQADLAGGKSLLPIHLQQKPFSNIALNQNDAKRRQWFKTSDDGCWENEAGEKWDEDDHNGMCPYDQCGDTDEEDESEEQEPGEFVETGGATVQKRWLVQGDPPE